MDRSDRGVRRRLGVLTAVLLVAATATACGGGDSSEAGGGQRNAATWKKDMSVIVINNREQPLAVVGVATTDNVGEKLVSQFSRIQYVSGSNADTVEFTVKLPTGDLAVVGRNPHFGDPKISINGDERDYPENANRVISASNPRIVVERKVDTSGLQNFEFWVGW